ncbi:MAG: 23S rRNA (adenine(2503)-C(2))-methyltransferase RlmN [Candidatus Omnitrophota bacterium]
MKWIYDLPYDELKEELTQTNFKKFVADQIVQWLYNKNNPEIDQWSNISKTDRERLAQSFNTRFSTVLTIAKDDEETRKFLIQLEDNQRIESVLIPEKHHYTFCISTQAGCPLGCRFCATGKLGFQRNLTPGEIVSQVLILKKELHDAIAYTGKLNLVFMGMGEPLLNYDNLKHALQTLTFEKGMNISPRNMTVSTAGILSELQRLETDFPNIKISFSLNASGSSLRETLMPISRKEKLNLLLDYFRNTKEKRKHRITFEYVLLKGVNDSLIHARKVSELIKGIPCKVNVIPYNENPALPFRTPPDETVDAFSDYLHSRGYTVIVRWSKGRTIRSACGQLAGEG